MKNNKKDKDIFGKAISDYYHHKDVTDIIVHSPDFDDDIIPVSYLFRTYEEMPPIEKEALQRCRGKVLDVGCGAGSHSLYLQSKKGLQVTAIDTSEAAAEICRIRGVEDARNTNFFELKKEKFDTILMLMNGSGIIGKLNNLDNFFSHVRELLTPTGQVLIDSSDLKYLFDEDDDGGIWINPEDGYYGEVQFRVSYKKDTSAVFDWLYIDFHSLELAANKNNFKCQLIARGEHHDYLAKITPGTT